MDENLFDETLVGEASTSANSADTKSAEEASENIALKRALERVKRDAKAQLHAGHWSVEDAPTTLLMVSFYEQLLQQGMRPVQALQAAKQWLRDVSVAQLAAFFGNPAATQTPTSWTDLVRQWPHEYTLAVRTHLAIFDSEERPFADPFYWAPFILVGV